MTRRTVPFLIALACAALGGGCGTIQNLGTDPVGTSSQPPGLVYGGVRSDIADISAYPIGPPILWVSIVVADAIGDTITLPFILALQAYDYVDSLWPKPPASQRPDVKPANGDLPNVMP